MNASRGPKFLNGEGHQMDDPNTPPTLDGAAVPAFAVETDDMSREALWKEMRTEAEGYGNDMSVDLGPQDTIIAGSPSPSSLDRVMLRRPEIGGARRINHTPSSLDIAMQGDRTLFIQYVLGKLSDDESIYFKTDKDKDLLRFLLSKNYYEVIRLRDGLNKLLNSLLARDKNLIREAYLGLENSDLEGRGRSIFNNVFKPFGIEITLEENKLDDSIEKIRIVLRKIVLVLIFLDIFRGSNNGEAFLPIQFMYIGLEEDYLEAISKPPYSTFYEPAKIEVVDRFSDVVRAIEADIFGTDKPREIEVDEPELTETTNLPDNKPSLLRYRVSKLVQRVLNSFLLPELRGFTFVNLDTQVSDEVIVPTACSDVKAKVDLSLSGRDVSLCVLGVGDGEELPGMVKKLQKRIDPRSFKVFLSDFSNKFISEGRTRLKEQPEILVEEHYGDFFGLDTEIIGAELNDAPHSPRIFLVTGFTATNYSPDKFFGFINGLLREEDYAYFDLVTFSDEESLEQMRLVYEDHRRFHGKNLKKLGSRLD